MAFTVYIFKHDVPYPAYQSYAMLKCSLIYLKNDCVAGIVFAYNHALCENDHGPTYSDRKLAAGLAKPARMAW